jgi:hypothetical protein
MHSRGHSMGNPMALQRSKPVAVVSAKPSIQRGHPPMLDSLVALLQDEDM